MKCPKCQYLTFDQGDRCRNCGYDFALSPEPDGLDLPIRTGDEPLGPLADFNLGEPRRGDDPLSLIEGPPAPPRATARRHSAELPLFQGGGSDAPLVSLPATPRAPVSVRKSAVPRAPSRRERPEELPLDLDADDTGLPTDAEEPAEVERPSAQERSAARSRVDNDTESPAAPIGARLVGGLIDLGLMATLDLSVLYFTLLVCDLTFAEVGRIPIAPFAAFLIVLNGGYMAAFTAAGGQSFGKMAAGIRVVSSDTQVWGDRVTLGQAALRAALFLISALPAGLGFAPALLGPDHRALHDRLAHTRVVKA
jgi:uncharacterized RDD family membrane protein YckC